MSETPAVYDVKPLVATPESEIRYGTDAANALVGLVKKAGLARKFGGEKEHIFYEGWQALGKFYGVAAKTGDALPIEIDGVKGAKAVAVLIDPDGTVVGGAEAYCMRDEPNWRNKPWFQLASMAQTRAGSKAFRNKFAFVVSLAGFATTPAEEMESINDRVVPDEHAEMRADLWKMLVEMAGSEAAASKDLKLMTTWEKDGKTHEGKSDVASLATKPNARGQTQLSVTFGQVKKIYDEWKDGK